MVKEKRIFLNIFLKHYRMWYKLRAIIAYNIGIELLFINLKLSLTNFYINIVFKN